MCWSFCAHCWDLNAYPAVLPCLAKAISAGRFVDLAVACSLGRRSGLLLPASSSWMIVLDLAGILSWVVPVRLLLPLLAGSRIGGFLPHFCLLSTFGIDGWSAEVSCPIVSQPLWPACWIHTPDRSSSSVSRAVQDAWDVYRDELGVVSPEVVNALRDAVSRSSVDDFCFIWSKNAEAGLFRAHCRADGPTEAGIAAFLGRGLLRIRSRCLGGRAVGGRGSSRLYRVSQGDEVDVHCS